MQTLDPFLRIVEFFDKDDTAGSFLREDGDGGFVGAIYRMAREIDALRSGGEPVAFMHADHIEQYKNKTADGIFWANNERTDFYTVPLFAHPAPSDLERELDEVKAEYRSYQESAEEWDHQRKLAEAERDALAAEKARLVERGWAFANQVRAVTYLLNGQAYSSTLSELNAFTAALGTSDKLAEARDGE